VSPGRVHVAVYGEVNMNLIDGSSIWLQSVATMLASLPGVEVTVLLRAPEERDLITGALAAHPQITLEPPSTGRVLKPPDAVAQLVALDDRIGFDLVLLRGAAVTDEAIENGRFDGRIWFYYIPPHSAPPGSDVARLERRGAAADRILCQTETIRARVEASVPHFGSKLVLLPPMIPPIDPGAIQPPASGPVRKLFYAGKFSPEYFFLEMVNLFQRLHADDPGLEFHVAGDKVHNPPADPDFRPAAEHALRETPGLVWHGAVERQAVRRLLGACDIALSIRHPSMDASTELSTKILEYGSAGSAVLLNRNPIHVGLLGADYPLLVQGIDEAVEAVRAVSADPSLRADAQRRCHDASLRHTFERVAGQLAPHVRPRRHGSARDTGSPRVLIAGHEFKFFERIAEHVLDSGAALREDRWAKHVVHDEGQSARALKWAETVVCEWCLGNAAYYSRNKRPGQRLVVRFHRMEVETDHPAAVDLDKVDAMVFVARHVMEMACEKYRWRPDDRFHVVPNAVDLHALGRPKLPDAQFSLGFIGFVPMLKRIDRAIDILERVRGQDDRFRLVVKGHPPWDYNWMFTRDAERRFYERVYDRLERSPLLRSAVTFEPFGPDIAPFLEKVGYILSLSDIEGHAVAPAEGMASGAVPVIYDRPGARDQYPPEWVHESTDAAATAVLRAVDSGWRAESQRAREYVEQWGWEQLAPAWDGLLGLQAAAHA